MLVDAVMLASLIPLSKKTGLAPRDLGFRAVPVRRSIVLVTLAVAAYALMAGFWATTLHREPAVNELAEIKNYRPIGLGLTLAAVPLFAPIVEEVFFRGLLYRSLRNRLRIFPAALIGGGLFGLVHIMNYPLYTLPLKAGFGFIACLLYERAGSLLPGIGLHSFVDASAINIAFTGDDVIVVVIFAALASTTFLAACVRATRARRPSL